MDAEGRLFLSEGRVLPVHIRDLGELGALVQTGDLEEAVLEGERALLEHPALTDVGREPSQRQEELCRSAGAVVRVELDFLETGILRQLAIYFDGGDAPPDCAG